VLGRYKSEVALVAEPVARAMVGLRLRPNQLSCLGLVCSMVAAVAFAADQRRSGALCLALAGALDILDGALARVSGQVSPFGAFLDSVLDRYSDLLVLAGLVFLFARLGRLDAVLAVVLALIGTVMVSYTRARAESVDVECRVGFMERGERMLVLIAGALFDLLIPAIWVVAVGANATAVHRIAHTWRATRSVLR
jgi:CDP-diacylglycerol---glycerol-3-phosphate 3-phosphatidyltransferase